MKSILNPDFKYVPADETDLRVTFRRIKTVETTIPFQGFCESIWSREIDTLAEQEAEYMTGDEGDYPDNAVNEILFRYTDHRAIFNTIAELYTQGWQDMINEELRIDIHLQFKEMVSPKEYNLTTDRLFADISQYDADQIYEKVGRPRLQDVATQMFTSRDGFTSFYEPDIEKWGLWDHNQIGCLMEAAETLIKDPAQLIYYAIQEGIGDTYRRNIDWQAVEHDLQRN